MVTEIHGLMTKSTIHILDAQGRTMREIATDIGRPYTFVRKVLRG
jgi:predicted transcriptional regulator